MATASLPLRMTARQFAAYCRGRQQAVIDAVKDAEQETIEEAKREAIDASSGTHSLADLAAAGHPYARRAPQTESYPPGLINAQTGEFRDSWHTGPSVVRGSTIETSLINSSPIKVYLEGTHLMVARPISAEVIRRITPRRTERLRAALRKALTQP